MKITQINTTCGVGSTGKICVGISQLLSKQDTENCILYGSSTNGYPFGIRCASRLYIKAQALKARVLGNYGFNSFVSSMKAVRRLTRFQPDVVHLHNLHGHDFNLKLLLKHLKREKIPVIWTFHDCWAFTAYCPYFTLYRCEQWKSECKKCPQVKQFSWFFDRSRAIFHRKKALMQAIDLTIVTPSQWLANLIKQSFLKNYPVKVINNGIDLAQFRPTSSNFKEKYRLGDKYVVLGVAFDWGKRKGLDVFAELARRLDEEYQIVLVGTNKEVEREIPDNVLCIRRTQNQRELAEIYSAADVFVNPTREEVFGLVNIESLACGTPVITFATGGSPEMLDDTCGVVVPCDDVATLEKEIRRVCTARPFSESACLERARKYDMNDRYEEYIALFKKVGM